MPGHSRATAHAVLQTARRRMPAWLPTGHALAQQDWLRRHQAISILLWVHVAAVPIYGIVTGQPPAHAIAESSVLAVLALAAGHRGLASTARSVMATLGLVTASAMLTHFSSGLIEMHFHFFVMVAVISLYQSWVPFLIALGFVVLHHGIGGQLAAGSVYNHASAARNAWIWALIHGGFILAESTACLIAWRLNEIALENERDARHEMAKAHDDLATAQLMSSVGSWEWDTESGVVLWSDELYRIVGREPGDFVPTVASFLAHVADHERERVGALIETAARTGAPLDYECEIVRADGERRVVHALGHQPATAEGEPVRVLGTCQDVSDRKALEAEIEHRAFHDALTGLANRALFLDRLEHALRLSGRSGASLSLLYLDLDDFKTVNDNLGHSVGDELLSAVADRLSSAVRSADTVARLGGDEFAILLEDTSAADAQVVATKLLDVMGEPLQLPANRLLIRASIGIAVHESADDAGDMLRHADIAMYAAKRQGKNSYRLFNEGMQSSLTARMRLEAELAEAIERDQFILHYQPLVDMNSEVIQGVEALVRWDHPQRGVLPPSEFIPVAEELGLITALGAWVLRQATTDARTLQETLGHELYVSVNVAAPQLHTDFVATVDAALAESGLDAHHLLLEITETCLMSQETAVVERLSTLRDMGVRIAIDDFGTGYSSLSYLRDLPIDLLKIDRSFVRDIAQGPEESALAHSIIKLGTVFGLMVVGEGIETSAQADVLRGLGCHTGQGYHYFRPTDLQSLIAATSGSAAPAKALPAAVV